MRRNGKILSTIRRKNRSRREIQDREPRNGENKQGNRGIKWHYSRAEKGAWNKDGSLDEFIKGYGGKWKVT